MVQGKKKLKHSGQFKKGHTKSVGYGRPKMTPEQKAYSLANRTQFKNLLNKYISMPRKELSKILRAADTPMLDKMVIQNIFNAALEGEQKMIDWIVDHVLGKPVAESTINLKQEISPTLISPKDMSDEQLEELKQFLVKIGKDGKEES